ncbi:MAG TPA: penicillin-binding transpeptidase domain-containing protein [Paenibacillus sp.]|nr:penicillin-binding transpeptidase domain-containing protein [Paenibacillus sp.]
MRLHRLFHVLLAFCLGLALLAGRLLWLQAWGAPPRGAAAADAAAMSVRQRSQGVTLDPGRGHIVDRHGVPLTGHTVNGLLLLPGGADRMTADERRTLARVLNVAPMRLLEEWRKIDRPAWWNGRDGAGVAVGADPLPLTAEQAARIRELRLPGATVASAVVRYPERRLAAHLVGFVAEQPERVTALYGKKLTDGQLQLSTPIGASGLELAFDRLLQGVGETRIVSYVDGQGEPLDGLGVQTVGTSNPYYPLRLISTIDAAAQRAVEAAADAAGLKEGAVVVLDVASSDIVAMASRPTYEAGRLSRAGEDWANRAIRAVAPGSIMKSFVAAAALEEGVVRPDETFDCDGTYSHYGLTCWKEGGHGRLTFAEALAESCNIAFAEVGERLSGETLVRYGTALGLIGPVGWKGVSEVDGQPLTQLPEEQPGRLFAGAPEAADGGVLAQTAIGQRDARWTPLLAANWMATVARGGAPASPRAAAELQYADGHAAEKYDPHRLPDGRDAISPATARTLRGMLEGVVEFGTGASLRSAAWPLAGKSGTAEATVDGRDVVHQWFVGYGPTDKPKYAVAVLAESRPTGSANRATAVFKAVMDALAGLPD